MHECQSGISVAPFFSSRSCLFPPSSSLVPSSPRPNQHKIQNAHPSHDSLHLSPIPPPDRARLGRTPVERQLGQRHGPHASGQRAVLPLVVCQQYAWAGSRVRGFVRAGLYGSGLQVDDHLCSNDRGEWNSFLCPRASALFSCSLPLRLRTDKDSTSFPSRTQVTSTLLRLALSGPSCFLVFRSFTSH